MYAGEQVLPPVGPARSLDGLEALLGCLCCLCLCIRKHSLLSESGMQRIDNNLAMARLAGKPEAVGGGYQLVGTAKGALLAAPQGPDSTLRVFNCIFWSSVVYRLIRIQCFVAISVVLAPVFSRLGLLQTLAWLWGSGQHSCSSWGTRSTGVRCNQPNF